MLSKPLFSLLLKKSLLTPLIFLVAEISYLVGSEKVYFMDKMEIKSGIFPIFLTSKKRAKQKTLKAFAD